MVKYLKTGKRIITLALSATLILGEASVSFAAPRANVDQAIDVIEESDTTGAFTPGKVINVGFKSYYDTGVINDKLVSWNAVQGASTYQYRITDAAGKEYVSYLSDYDYAKKVYKQIGYNSTFSLDKELEGFDFRLIQAKDGGYVYVEDADENFVRMKPGTKYNFQVRAVRYSQDNDTYGPWSDSVSFTTSPITTDKVSDFGVLQTADGTIGLKYSSTGGVELEIKDAAGNYYYEDAHDEYDNYGKVTKTIYQYKTLGQQDAGVYTYLSDIYAYILEKKGNNKNYSYKKDEYGNSICAFRAGETYYVRIRGFGYDEKGEKKVGEWSQAVTVKVPVRPKPEKPGNLEYDPHGYVHWSKINNASYYEFELKDSEGKQYVYYEEYYDDDYDDFVEYGDATTENYSVSLDSLIQATKNADGSYSIFKDAKGNVIYAGAPGKKYTVRVRSVNRSNVLDAKNHDYPYQYSDWTAPITFTVEAAKNVDPAKVKVTGLRYVKGDNYLKWDTPDDLTGLKEVRYEVELKDNLNRTYSTLYTEDGVQKLRNYISDSTSASNIKTYVKIDDKYEPVIDQNGNDIRAFSEGFKYTARVRLVAWTGDSEEDKYGAWSDAYTFTVPVTSASSGINSKPAKVTGVWVKTKPGENERLYVPKLYWNKIDNVSYYEVELKDAAGNVFLYGADVIDGKLIPNYYSVSSDTNCVDLNYMSNLTSYKKVDGSALSILRDSNGDIVWPFLYGQNYTFRVRAVNEYYQKNSDGTTSPKVQYVGDWSDPVTYTESNGDLKVKGLKYVKSDDDYYYFDVDADQKYSQLYYQIATDASFSDSSVLFGWVSSRNDYLDNYKLVISKKYLDESKTYYVRVVNSRYGDPEDVRRGNSIGFYNSI